MNNIKNYIVSYFDELINQIDESTEILLSKSDATFHDTINTKRNNLIHYVKKHQTDSLEYYESIKNQISMTHDKEEIFTQIFKTKFCFFISSIKKADFLSTKEIGKLVITNQYLPSLITTQIIKLVNKEMKVADIDKKIDNYLKIKLIHTILNNRDGEIIDLSNTQKNVIKNVFLMERFECLGNNTFDQLENLINLDQIETLDIAFDGIDELYPDWFKQFQSIKRLFVGGCLDHSDLKIVLKMPENLESLSLLKNKLDCFTKEMFQFENLKNIIFNENGLKLIDTNAFSNLKKLETIYIINNGASIRIDESAFEGLDKLEILDLKNSEILSIDHLNLRDLKNLKVLVLSNNFLKNINPEIINRFVYLEVLDLIGNPELEFDIELINLHNLKCLFLEKTGLKKLDIFPKLQALEINKLISFDQNCFNFPNSIDYLKLGISRIDVNSINLCHFNGLQNMVFIELNSENSNLFNIENLERLSGIFSSLVDFEKCEIQTDSDPVFRISGTNSMAKKNYKENILNIQVKKFFSDSEYF
ncbi:unnamed protein product [Brachionus calyciflorus]|uniref:Uncharacterized protein n=1 Tax=Brachionus calyciflorus TaxID=104777 RepID=A0A813YQ98_9BILA|nr:unnamed protein product [Brachionus calyciflorus]